MRVIEFLGQTRAGKTTQVLLLKEYLEKKGFTVAVSLDRERAKAVHVPPSECLAFNLVFHSKVIDEYYQHKGTVDFFLVDRGFADVAVWAEVLYLMKKITAEERDAYRNCWKRFRKMVDVTFYFEVPLEVLFERWKSLPAEAVDEVVMNKTWMATLERVYQKLKKKFPQMIEIDGRKGIKETQQIIQKALAGLL